VEKAEKKVEEAAGGERPKKRRALEVARSELQTARLLPGNTSREAARNAIPFTKGHFDAHHPTEMSHRPSAVMLLTAALCACEAADTSVKHEYRVGSETPAKHADMAVLQRDSQNHERLVALVECKGPTEGVPAPKSEAQLLNYCRMLNCPIGVWVAPVDQNKFVVYRKEGVGETDWKVHPKQEVWDVIELLIGTDTFEVNGEVLARDRSKSPEYGRALGSGLQ